MYVCTVDNDTLSVVLKITLDTTKRVDKLPVLKYLWDQQFTLRAWFQRLLCSKNWTQMKLLKSGAKKRRLNGFFSAQALKFLCRASPHDDSA